MKTQIQRLCARFYQFLCRQERFWLQKKQLESGFLKIGKHTYGCPKLLAFKGSECHVYIGSYCSIAPDVTAITGGVHPLNWVSTFPFRAKWNLPGAFEDGMPSSKGDIVIGSDVWVGTEALILSGVTIGDGAVVAARAVVTRNVPPYAIVGGAPAKIIDYRFPHETVEKLLSIRWWEWEDQKVKNAIPLLSSPDISGFLETYLVCEQNRKRGHTTI